MYVGEWALCMNICIKTFIQGSTFIINYTVFQSGPVISILGMAREGAILWAWPYIEPPPKIGNARR